MKAKNGSTQDSSILFSLDELLKIEQERISQEEQSKKAKEEAEITARAVQLQMAQQLAKQKQREQLEAQRRASEREREMQAKEQAIIEAAIAEVAIKNQAELRLSQLAQEHEHEVQLAALQSDQGRKKLRQQLLMVCAALILTLTAGTSLYLGKIRPESQAQHQKLHDQRVAHENELNSLKSELQSTESKIAALKKRRASADSKEERNDVDKKLANENSSLRKKQRKIQTLQNRHVKIPISAPKTHDECAGTGDPMCY
jgi:colicin import membrane protein